MSDTRCSAHTYSLAAIFKGYHMIKSILHEIAYDEALNTFITNEANSILSTMTL